MLVPYVAFMLPTRTGGALNIEQVYLGPTQNANNSMKSLSEFLSKEGSSPTQGVFYSGIPYRQP